MKQVISAIALNTFRETMRDRLLYSLVAFAVLVIATTLLAGSVSLGQDLRVVQNFGLTAILVFQVVITLLAGTQLVWREVERKTVYTVLSKPITREQFYIGKFIGLCQTLLVTGLIMGAILAALVMFKGGAITLALVLAVLFIILESWLLSALGMLFAGFTGSIASSVYTFALALIGHASTTIWLMTQKAQGLVKIALQLVYYVFPNLEKFNLRNDVVFNLQPDAIQIGSALLYFAAYTVALLLAGLAVFKRHEF